MSIQRMRSFLRNTKNKNLFGNFLEKAFVDYLEHFYPGYCRFIGTKKNELTENTSTNSEKPLSKELEKAFDDYLEHFYPGYRINK